MEPTERSCGRPLMVLALMFGLLLLAHELIAGPPSLSAAVLAQGRGRGDADGDGLCSGVDALAALQMAAGTLPQTST